MTWEIESGYFQKCISGTITDFRNSTPSPINNVIKNEVAHLSYSGYFGIKTTRPLSDQLCRAINTEKGELEFAGCKDGKLDSEKIVCCYTKNGQGDLSCNWPDS